MLSTQRCLAGNRHSRIAPSTTSTLPSDRKAATRGETTGTTTMLFELKTLSCSILGVPDASKSARAWAEKADAGRLLGVWRSDIGPVAQLFVLRAFEEAIL